MFELFKNMAKKPTLTKLDDDGETQMDMCKLWTRAISRCARWRVRQRSVRAEVSR